MKKYIIIIFFILILICLFFHPLTYIKYFYQNITNNSSEYFSIADGYYRNNTYDTINYEANHYFSKNRTENLQVFDISNFTDNGLIYIQAYLYDSLNDVEVFLNNKKINIEETIDYYNIFNDDYYIVKTIRVWVAKQNLIINNINKIDFIIDKNIYSYYFKVIN